MKTSDATAPVTTEQSPRPAKDTTATSAPASDKKPYAPPRFFRHNPLDSVSSSYYYYYTY